MTQHNAELLRCLLTLDVAGMMSLWRHMAPHLAEQSPKDALIAMHIARCEMRTIPRKAKDYSRAWLAERGYQCIEGRWVAGLPPAGVVAQTVGIAVRSKYPVVQKRIHRAMDDALQNAMAKGVTEAPMQKEAMLKARAKERFKMRIA
ncbi:MAG: hypothetical protein ABFD96_25370 [Armatimonadia bacterium]